MAPHLAGAITVHAMNKPLGPYTPAVRAGDFVFVSGQLGMRDGSLVDGGVAGETALTDVVKTTCFLIDMDMFATFNTAYVEAFGDHRPARSTIAVRELPAKGQVEIEAVAYSPRG